MKIVFIISSLGSGGAERVLVLIANYLSNTHKIIIITFSNKDSFYQIDNKIEIIHLNLLKKTNNKFESFYNSIKRILTLKRALKQTDADINISFMTHTNILSIIASKLNRQKIIVSEDIEYSFYNDRFLFFIRKFIYKLSDFLVVKTFSDKQNYHFLKRVNVIVNPLPDISFQLNAKKEQFILAVGRLDKQKGFDSLVKSFSMVNTCWKLYIAGEGTERKNLENLIKKLKLEKKIILLGRQKNIFEWYKKASIFVLSSRKEGFGNVLIEAMAFICAVISFDCPYGPSEIIENEINGILVENQNIEKLAFQIQRLINDEDLREKLGNEAIKVREEYSIEKIANQWENLIKKVVDV